MGKKTTITTDQFNLIVDYQVMENQADSEIVLELSKRIFSRYGVASWSFDKGYWHKNNKTLNQCLASQMASFEQKQVA